MIRVKKEKGQLIRKWDSQPLKTKIVATMGSPESYVEGIYDLNLDKTQPPFTYDQLIENFILNGVNVIRLNMAYMNERTTDSFFKSLRNCVRKIQPGKCPKIAVLTDLPGPRIRFEEVPENGINVQKGDIFTIRFEKLRNGNMDGASVCINEKPLKEYDEGAFANIMNQIGDKIESSEEVRIIVGDGEVMMRVKRDKFERNRSQAILECEVIKEGKIGNARFTVKDIDFSIGSFTKEDEEKLEILFKSGAFQDDGLWAFVGLSFTQSADDILRAKEFIEVKSRDKLKEEDSEHASWYAPALIAKIETNRGYENREEILDVADGIMVARGDLGVQKAIEEIGTIEKELIKLCNKQGKPVITATQMLGSMVESLEPTRAEVTDVFNSILDSTDAVMLSEETSRGCYPFHAIFKIASIAAEAEHFYEKVEMGKAMRSRLAVQRYQEFLVDAEDRINKMQTRIRKVLKKLRDERVILEGQFGRTSEEEETLKTLKWREALYDGELEKLLKQKPRTTNCTSQAVCIFSETEGINAIIALTTTGRTARMISRFRPSVKIIGATHDDYNACKLVLSYGVIPVNFGNIRSQAGPGEMFEQAGKVVIEAELLLTEDGVVLTSGNRPKEPGTTNTIQIQERLIAILPVFE